MDLSRSEYPAMLASLQPVQAVEVLNDRIKHVSRLNSEVADWLQERRRVEEAYAMGLRKLAQKKPPDADSDMGIFTTPWQKLVNSAETLAESHHLLAQKIEADIERPLRNFAGQNREMQAMSTISGNLAAMAKEVDNAQKKAEKLQTKGGKAATEKVASAAAEVENANSQWESQAPFVFEKLQAVDETRLNYLRDVLTQFQTHEVDQVERNRIGAEDCLNALLSVETADEIKAFQIRAVQGRPKLRARRRTLPGSSSYASNDMPPPPLPSHPTAHDDNALTQTLSPQPMGEDSSQRSASDRKKSVDPYGRPEPERKSSSNLTSAFASFGSRGKSRGNDREMPPTAEEEEPMSPPMRAEPNRRESITAAAVQQSTQAPEANGVTLDSDEITPAPRVNGSQMPSFNQEPLQPIKAPTSPSAGPQDAEGFSVAPLATDAITQAEQEAAATQAEPQFKLDIRSSPIQEEDSDAKTAFDNVANTLRAQAAPQARRPGTVRGRRDVRNTIFVPNPQTLDLSGTMSPEAGPSSAPLPASPPATSQTSPFKPGQRSVFLTDDLAASDTQSVRSGRSLASAASGTIRHPDLHGPGLNTSIVETISAWFEQGNLTKAQVFGEVALAYNHQDLSAPFGSENIRLDNFSVLEKVAPNPAFIDQIPDKPGYYSVNLASITKTSVAFKYQVHHESPTAATRHAPLLLTPQWKVEPTQTSVILAYSLNPEFALPEGVSTVTLANMALIIHLDSSGAKAKTARAANGGNFVRERSAVYWRLPEVNLTKDGPVQQLRARFFTDGEAKPGAAEARWEISNEHSVALGSGLSVSMLETKDGQNPESDPFADEDAGTPAEGEKEEVWKEVSSVKQIKSGATYTAI
ncbi:hypothetical protein NA57DRAFT_34067 [Rhizodiscina lignyota]|uniref:MHD domain-containing protein n=1 Tax=Rhizodiscina lignyota TaxID=1504668 RepID=A0A9P4IHX0_9PEZI|nr:hypothetical protein NA57DRAFT_34067 [Rhizodiscina lignyota]